MDLVIIKDKGKEVKRKMVRIPQVSQQEFNRVLNIIERNTQMRFLAGTNHSSAFMVGVNNEDAPTTEVVEWGWNELEGLARHAIEYPHIFN